MRILMTGGTSGIGLVAARRLMALGHAVTIGARRPGEVPADLKSKAAIVPLDLADLVGVERFVEAAAAAPAYDVMVLNAGLQVTSPQRSAQGLDLTFAANHLAHFLIARRLAPRLDPGGRVVITSSGTHDPETKSGMPPPLDADALRLAHPETDPKRDANAGTAGRRAYSSSKLCNVMTARELAKRLADTRPDIAVAAYDPAFVPATGLARGYPAPARFLVSRILPTLLRGREWVSTPEVSGAHLARLASAPEYGTARGGYFSVRSLALREVQPSALARDDDACARLWDDSAALLAELGVATHPVAEVAA